MIPPKMKQTLESYIQAQMNLKDIMLNDINQAQEASFARLYLYAEP